MAVENIRLAWNFYSDALDLLSYTSEAGNMFASNLQNSQPSVKWRSTDTSQQTFVFDYGQLRSVSFFLIYNHNLSVVATVRRLIALDSNFLNVVFDETYNAQTPVYGYGQGFYGLTGYGGFSTDGAQFPFTAIWHDTVVGQYEKLIITDPSNSDGYMEAGRYASGDYWTPQYANLKKGYGLEPFLQSKQNLLLGGGTTADRLPSLRKMSISFSYLSKDDESALYEMMTRADKNKNVFVSVYPGEGTTTERLHTMLGFIESNNPITRDTIPYRSSGFTLKEAK